MGVNVLNRARRDRMRGTAFGGQEGFGFDSEAGVCSRVLGWAQVAEWLMAADCKSAGLRPTEVRTLPCAPEFARSGMSWQEKAEVESASQNNDGPDSASAKLGTEPGAELERKARIAFGLYLVLAGLAWFTLDGSVLVYGRPVEIRLVPLIVLGGLAARTLLALKAEKIRRSSSQDREEVLKG